MFSRLIRDIPINIDTDECPPSLCDITVVYNGGSRVIAVSDYDNKALKFVYENGNVEQLRLPGHPRGLTSVDGMILTTVKKKIFLVTVTPGLTIHSKIPVEKMYSCLTIQHDVTPKMILAGDTLSQSVDILDLTGIIRGSVKGNYKASYLHYSKDSKLLLSDNITNALICLTIEGVVLWRYSFPEKGLQGFPWGVTTSTITDNVLVAARDSNRVLRIEPNREDVQEMESSLPVGVCHDEITDQLLVCSSDGNISIAYMERKNKYMEIWDSAFYHNINGRPRRVLGT